MNRRLKVVALAGMVALLCGWNARAADPALETTSATEEPGVTLAVARDRAKLMHNVYSTTLEVMHDRYFHDERAIVPARALEDVFEEISKQSKMQARWISVNTKPMSIQHAPKSPFEKQAAEAIAAGNEEFELVEKDVYRRAAAIPLTAGCVSCHTGFFAGAPKSPRFAALVISIPLAEE